MVLEIMSNTYPHVELAHPPWMPILVYLSKAALVTDHRDPKNCLYNKLSQFVYLRLIDVSKITEMTNSPSCLLLRVTLQALILLLIRERQAGEEMVPGIKCYTYPQV